MADWRNRIVGHGVKPASQFLANPLNWRTHPKLQREAIVGILGDVGWVQEVIENVRTGNLIDGHERVWDALENGDASVPFIQVDLSTEEERLILVALDPLSAIAIADGQKLDELLQQVQTDDAALSEVLNDLSQSADAAMLKEPPSENSDSREMGDTRKQIKPVLYAEDIATFEEALALTGEMNRGQALMAICLYYVSEKGKLDTL